MTELLDPVAMIGLAETKEGRRELARYIWKARAAYAAQYVMEALEIIPEPKLQQLVCDIIWNKCFACDIFEVLDHARSMCEAMKGQLGDGGYDA